MTTRESTLVVSGHAADFTWRAGDAIALAASRGMAQSTRAEAYMRVFPQVTDGLA